MVVSCVLYLLRHSSRSIAAVNGALANVDGVCVVCLYVFSADCLAMNKIKVTEHLCMSSASAYTCPFLYVSVLSF